MRLPTIQENLLRFANSKNSSLTLYECSTPKGSKTFTLYNLNRQVFNSETEVLVVPEHTVVITYRHAGCIIIRRDDDDRPLIASPGTATLYSPGQYLVRPSKGQHRVLILTAHLPEHSVVHEYMKAVPFCASVRNYSQDVKEKINILAEATATEAGPNYFGVAGTYYLTMQALLAERYSVDFGAVPAGLSPSFQELCEKVRQDPHSEWTIDVASRTVGFSPPYFSRTFKQAAGEGFHTYVQRVRLSKAAQLLCTGESRMPVILKQSGFASQQAMRETFRSELGLLPADFKAIGDASASSMSA